MLRPLTFVDIETTGLLPNLHEIIEIAIIRELPDGTVDEWCSKIAPRKLYTASKKALQINGFSYEEWKDSPTIYQVVPEMVERLVGTTPVAHNSCFDKSFILPLSPEDVVLPYHWIDTISIAHAALPGNKRFSLRHLCDVFGISNEGSHRALADARRCRKLYKALMELIDVIPPGEIESVSKKH